MMFTQWASLISSMKGSRARPMPPRYFSQARCDDSITSREVTAAETAKGVEAEPTGVPRRPTTFSVLFTEAHLLGADLAQQAGGTHDQDDQEDDEPHRAAQHRIDVVAGESLDDADDQAAEVGAPDAAQAAEHDDR